MKRPNYSPLQKDKHASLERSDARLNGLLRDASVVQKRILADLEALTRIYDDVAGTQRRELHQGDTAFRASKILHMISSVRAALAREMSHEVPVSKMAGAYEASVLERQEWEAKVAATRKSHAAPAVTEGGADV